MRCKKCGKELAEGASFCPKCGYPTNQESRRIQSGNTQQGRRQYIESAQPAYSGKEIYESTASKSSMDFVLIGILVALIVVVSVLLIIFSMTILGSKKEVVKEKETIVEKETQDLEEKTEKSTATTQVVSTTSITQATTQAVQPTTEATTQAVLESVQVGPISTPDWDVYKDPDYGFSIKYPSHFVLYNDGGTRNRYTLSAPDGTADLRIFSYEDQGLSPEELGREFENTWGGEREYFRTGKRYYAVRTAKDGVCYYEFGERSVGRGVTGFTLIYDKSYHSIYDDYVNIIYQSRSWKK